MPIFEIVSKLGKKVRLTEIQWTHIKYKHIELDNQISKMISALQEPDFVYYSPLEENYHYVKLFKETPISEKYLLIIIKHLNQEGFVITGFFVSEIKRKEKRLVYGEEDFDNL